MITESSRRNKPDFRVPRSGYAGLNRERREMETETPETPEIEELPEDPDTDVLEPDELPDELPLEEDPGEPLPGQFDEPDTGEVQFSG